MADARFAEAEERYRSLKQQLDAGRITGERFEQALWEARFESGGRWWMLGANTGRWYAFDGQAWEGREPPVGDAATTAVGTPAPTDPVPTASDRTIAAQVLRVLALAGVAALAIFSLVEGVQAFGDGDAIAGTIVAGFGLLLIAAIVSGALASKPRA